MIDDGLELLYEREMESELNACLNDLDPRVQKVIRLRFYDKMTLEAIGKQLGISRDRVRLLESKGLRNLRHPVRIRRLMDAKKYFDNLTSAKVGVGWGI